MTTASQTAAPARPTEPICPSWCSGHRDDFQAWEELVDGTGHIRDHSSEPTWAGEIAVAVGVTERDDNTLAVPGVEVYVNEALDRLSANEAHEIGLAFLRAAKAVRDHSGDKGVHSVHTLSERQRLLTAVVEIRAEMFDMMARLDARVARVERLKGVSVTDIPGGAA